MPLASTTVPDPATSETVSDRVKKVNILRDREQVPVRNSDPPHDIDLMMTENPTVVTMYE